MKVPDYYQPIMPYLCVDDANGFISFLENVFDAEIKLTVPREDGTLMHAEAILAKGTIMFTQANDLYKPYGSVLFVFTPKAMDYYQKALALGAISIQEPDEREYGLSAGFSDAWNNTWWLAVPNKG
ncbi:hypothetical protein [Pedobacter sp. MW01-1-1]|uniref:hypothetical protein n=1 Tax=Pedobacter sp. MW01-1-1 TaxID=3383027 RepID=UPI003FEF2AD4